MSLRLRLMLSYSGLLTAILILFGSAVFGILRWTMLSQTDATLNRVLEDVLNETGGTVQAGPGGQPQLTAFVPPLDTFRTPGVYVQIWRVYNGQSLFSASTNLGNFVEPLDPNSIGTSEPVKSDVHISDTHLRVITKPIMIENQMVGNVQAAASLTTLDAATDRLLRILLAGGLIALLISLLIGDWIARRTQRPIAAIVAAAQSITAADDLERRIPYDGTMDEMGRMVGVFNETLARLEQLFQAQRRFVGDVSHELRTPLTTIQGNLDLIRMYGNDPKSLEAIQSEAKRMSRLVGDLLLLAQADSGQIPIQMEKIALDRFMLEIYNEAILLSGGQHKLSLGQFDQAEIYAHPDRLKQLMLNLVTNAIKYTPDGGRITISIVNRGDKVYTSVEDTGIGIPQADLPHIFDRFYRVDKARARIAGGSGLGLSIAKWIAEVHHGKIEVSSEVGEGTKFTVVLPQAQNNPAPSPIEAPHPALAGLIPAPTSNKPRPKTSS